MNEKYSADLCILSEWIQDEPGLEIQVNAANFWTPQLLIENCLQKIEEKIKYSFRKEDDHEIISETRFIKG
jgi:hypothetical protein